MSSSKARRHDGPVRLDRVAQRCLGPAVTRQGFGTAEILTAWSEIVGPELAERARPERIRWPRRDAVAGGGRAATLVVRAEGGDALEIQHRTDEILTQVNAFLGWGAVGRLVVRQVPVATAGSSRSGDPAAVQPGGIDPKGLDNIEEPGLRAAFSRLARASSGGNNSA